MKYILCDGAACTGLHVYQIDIASGAYILKNLVSINDQLGNT